MIAGTKITQGEGSVPVKVITLKIHPTNWPQLASDKGASSVSEDSPPTDFLLALPETVADEMSRLIFRKKGSFPEDDVSAAQVRTQAAFKKIEDDSEREKVIGDMLQPTTKHSNLQGFLRAVKFGMARCSTAAANGDRVTLYYEINGEGIAVLTGVVVAKHAFDFRGSKSD